MTFDLPSPPSLNHYWRRVGARTVLSRDGRRYKETVATRCLLAEVRPIREHVVVTIHWRRPAKRGDLDNHAKAILDAVRGHAFVDDSQVIELHMYRTDDKANPGVTVTVEAA